MIYKNVKTLIFGTMAFFAFSCTPDPEVPNEEELITTVIYTLTPVGGGPNVELTFTDLDGDGGSNPIKVGGSIDANKSYTGSIKFLNQSKIPAEDITAEIAEEDEDHQIFYTLSTALKSIVNIKTTDVDSNGKSVGLNSSVVTTAKGAGDLTITLRHEPNKKAAGVAEGDITNAGGETDIEVSFPVVIK